MINILGKIPRDVTLACSGGQDSMAVLDFLMNGKRNVTVAHFNHGTNHGRDANKFISSLCADRNIDLVSETLVGKKPAGDSWEDWWRNKRYEFFRRLNAPIITAHHLNDVAEWWLFTSFRGSPRLMPHRNRNVIRPFLTTPSSELTSWCERKGVDHVIDPGNTNFKFSRSRIRHNILPEVLKVNPGFLTVLRKKIDKEFNKNNG